MWSETHYYQYVDARFIKTGIMLCTVCGKAIYEGEYRFYETAEAYFNTHKHCCSDDPEWARRDAIKEAAEQRLKNIEKDFNNILVKYDLEESDLIEILGLD
tara:strand:- start:2231 stop:2533 length:303 start_codon:yes stop_codon:yes gene_type:complete